MKRLQILTVLALFILGSASLLACSANPTPTPTAVPPTILPTIAPTSVPPTTVPPTAVPATVAPTKTAAPTSTLGAPTGSASDTKQVAMAFQKFLSATTFTMDAKATVSPVLFQPKYTPQPGDDPNLVTVVAMQGQQDNSNFDFTVKGFAASFIGIVGGFDPNAESLELASVNGTNYIKGVKDGEKEMKWYQMSSGDTTASGFQPSQFLAPVVNGKYADDAFAASGTDVVDQKNCTVYAGNRAAFELILPEFGQSALLNTDAFDAKAIDTYSFKVWVCNDGDIHRIVYSFETPTKADASKRGSFSFDAQVKDYDAAIVIPVPTDAVPFGGTASATEAPLATATSGVTKNFTSLDGDWEGTIGEDSPLEFTVTDNKITFVNLNYAINTGGCSASGSFGKSVDDGAIANSSASFVLTDSDNVNYTVKGTFASNNSATGTVGIKGKTFCGDTDMTTPWTAKHISAPGEEPTEEATPEATEAATEAATEEPTEAATAENTGDSATAVVNGVFDALAKNDIDTALAAFDDNVIYNVGTTSGIGKDSLRSNLQLALAVGATFKVSNVQDVAGIVTFTVTVSGPSAGTFTNSSAIVQNGKIAIFTIK